MVSLHTLTVIKFWKTSFKCKIVGTVSIWIDFELNFKIISIVFIEFDFKSFQGTRRSIINHVSSTVIFLICFLKRSLLQLYDYSNIGKGVLQNKKKHMCVICEKLIFIWKTPRFTMLINPYIFPLLLYSMLQL